MVRETMEVLSPIGVQVQKVRPLAPRIPTLQGRIVGLLDNNKPGSREVLEGLKAALADVGIKGFFYRRKAHPAGPSPYVDDVSAAADAVISALGD